jgi:hypothetical protein
MISLLLSMSGAFPFYRRSKYFPTHVHALSVSLKWGYVLLLGSFLVSIAEFGAAVGAVVGVVTLMLAYSALVFVLSLPRFFRIGFLLLLFLLTVIHYACTK